MPTLDLALVGNCAIGSLVSPDGRHVWCCFPRLDGDPVFNALVNGVAPQTGFMDIEVTGRGRSRQSYVRNTAILETEISDEFGGTLVITDFAPRFQRFGRMFRPPMLIRRLTPAKGRPRVRARIRPTFEYGATKPHVTVGSNHMRFVGPNAVIRVTTDMPVAYLTDEAEFVLHKPINIIIGPDETIPESPEVIATRFLSETETYWHDWVRGLAIPFDWQDEVIRAAITLKLCGYEDTGAILAALTTSIPEAPGSARNWDYRFAWLRDAWFTVNALNRLGATRTMESYVRFVIDAALRGDGIAPLYPVAPATDLAEREAPVLEGYRGMGPVRFGNAAVSQRQNDVYGSIILTGAQMFWDRRLPRRGDETLYRQLCTVGQAAQASALEPDSGPWEYRGRTRVHTFSAAMCWAALHHLALIANYLGFGDEADAWQRQAETIRKEVLQRAVTKDGWLSGALDAEVADASTLLVGEIGLLPATDERMLRTLDITEKRLMRNGFVMRYDEADDFGAPETAFLVCTFWYIEALAAARRRSQASDLFKNVLARRNHVGLLSEDIDPATGELWGNFPQSYSQVGLIQCALRLSRTWEEGLWRAS